MYPYDNNYLNPFAAGAYQQPQQTVLPPQRVLQANGKSSIENLRMSPDSSVFIRDATNPSVLWYCVSDSLGNVSKTMYDIKPHEDMQLFTVENLVTIVSQLNDRLKKLEGQSENNGVDGSAT